jgi:quinol monooxygenase YgiN
MRSEQNVFSIFEGEVLDRAKLEDVMRRMVSKVQADEPGTLDYEWTVSEDGKSCAFYERYQDSEAMLSHVRGFGAFAEDFMAAVKPTGFKIYGSASDDLRATLADFGPSYYTKIGGFVR